MVYIDPFHFINYKSSIGDYNLGSYIILIRFSVRDGHLFSALQVPFCNCSFWPMNDKVLSRSQFSAPVDWYLVQVSVRDIPKLHSDALCYLVSKRSGYKMLICDAISLENVYVVDLT